MCKCPNDPRKCLIRDKWVCFSVFVLPDQIWSFQSCCVPVDNCRDYMLPVKSNKPLMQLILGTRSQNIEVMDPHPSIGRKELVQQTRFSLLNLLQDDWLFHSTDYTMYNIFVQHKGICMAYGILHSSIYLQYVQHICIYILVYV